MSNPSSARLEFRAPSERNAEDLRALLSDEHVRRSLFGAGQDSLQSGMQVLESAQAEARRGLDMWLLYERDRTPPVGLAGYARTRESAPALELAYALRPPHSAPDYALEVAVALIDFAREHRAEGDIFAAAEEPDLGSQRVLTRLGFHVVGSHARGRHYRLPRGRAPLERRTKRLVLRPFDESDRDWFARLNADSRVMQYFPSTLTRAASDALLDGLREHVAQRGFAPWAIELSDTGAGIGAAGLAVPGFESGFTPCVEIAWRLAAEHWSHGYAQEAARAALYTAFVHLELPQVVSFTATSNERSWRVMQRLGMQRDASEDFDHPNVAPGHPLRRHVLYRLNADGWRANLKGPSEN